MKAYHLATITVLTLGAVHLKAGPIDAIISAYTGSPEQNHILWQNFHDLRQPGVKLPPDVLKGFNEYRVKLVQEARLEAVEKIFKSGKYQSKDLSGFLNTGTWNNAGKFQIKSDIDFTAMGRNPNAVKDFQQEFYQSLGKKAGIHPDEVIRKLDVNCYSMAGTEAGAFKTAGGSYETISKVGGELAVTKTHVDNAFIDIGKSVPKFTPRDSAEFISELRGGVAENSTKYLGNPAGEAKANAKLVERADYAASVSAGKKAGEDGSLVLQESLELRKGASLENALAKRTEKFVAQGLTHDEALGAATREFITETRGFVSDASVKVVRDAIKSEGSSFSKFEEGLAAISANKTSVLFHGTNGLLIAYSLYSSYQEGGKTGLAKEFCRQGCFQMIPATALADLAAAGVKISGEIFLETVNGYVGEGVIKDMFGKTPEAMIAFAKAHPNPAEFKKFFDREWAEQYAGKGFYENRGWSDDKVKEIVFKEADSLRGNIFTAISEQRTKQKAAIAKMKEDARAERELLDKEKKADKSLQPDEDETDKEINLAVEKSKKASVDRLLAKNAKKAPAGSAPDDTAKTAGVPGVKKTVPPKTKPTTGKPDKTPTESDLIRAEADRLLAACNAESGAIANQIKAIPNDPEASIKVMEARMKEVNDLGEVMDKVFRKYLALMMALEDRCKLQEDIDYVENKADSIRLALPDDVVAAPKGKPKPKANGSGGSTNADGSKEEITYESDGKGGTRPITTFYDKNGKIIRRTGYDDQGRAVNLPLK